MMEFTASALAKYWVTSIPSKSNLMQRLRRKKERGCRTIGKYLGSNLLSGDILNLDKLNCTSRSKLTNEDLPAAFENRERHRVLINNLKKSIHRELTMKEPVSRRIEDEQMKRKVLMAPPSSWF